MSPLVKPQPMFYKLKARLGHEHVTVDSIGGTFRPGRRLQSRKLSTQRCRFTTVLDAYIIIALSIPIKLDGCWTDKTGLTFNPGGCLAKLILRK